MVKPIEECNGNKAYLTVKLTSLAGIKITFIARNDLIVLYRKAITYRIKVTLGISATAKFALVILVKFQGNNITFHTSS